MPARSEFGAFLRSRRERVSPEEVGFPTAGRRRTPGLRREEVAALAGISVDYLVRLEQGRENNPSGAVLAALARTLRLSEDEAKHLRSLVAAASCEKFCPSAPPGAAVDDTIVALLDQLGSTPAFVINYLSDLLVWNGAYERLMTGTGLLDSEPPNLLRYTFLDQRSRDVYRGWEAIAREQVCNLRAATGRWRDDGSIATLVGELSVASADFARLWAEHDVSEKRSGVKELVFPAVGGVRIRFATLSTPDDEGNRLVVYFPADATAEPAFDRLVTPVDEEDDVAARPVLRVVASGA